jgi:hypothetical protein
LGFIQNQLSFDFEEPQASEEIIKLLSSDEPCMISRFGSNELAVLIYFEALLSQKSLFSKAYSYLKDDISEFWIDPYLLKNIKTGAGFFPSDFKNLEIFYNLIIKDISQIDILGSWLTSEKYIRHYIRNAKTTALNNLEPYFSDNPWTSVLKDKNILVIHPFSKTIEKQYINKNKLFSNEKILPDFNLLTYKPVQSGASEASEFKTWFEALDKMTNDISKMNFDIAIIGAGAYGLPLAANIKRLNKKAFHLGGATQILFGIIGKRWEKNPNFVPMFNNYWTRPSSEEQPKSFEKVEGGCYW